VKVRSAAQYRTFRHDSGDLSFIIYVFRGGFDVSFPVTRDNFALAHEVFLQTLKELDSQTVFDKLAQWQLRRRILFEAPADACDDAIGEIVSWNQTFSFRQIEDSQDAVTLDSIFVWRDYLLQAEPYIIKMRTTE